MENKHAVYKNLFLELAERFERQAGREDKSVVGFREAMATDDEAGRVVIAAWGDGLLKLDGLGEWVAWAEAGGDPPPGAEPRGAIDLGRIPANVFTAVVGADNIGVSSLLGDVMTHRQAVRLYTTSDAEHIRQSCEVHHRTGYQRKATACRALAEMIGDDQPNAGTWVTQAEAARKIGVNRATIKRWAENPDTGVKRRADGMVELGAAIMHNQRRNDAKFEAMDDEPVESEKQVEKLIRDAGLDG